MALLQVDTRDCATLSDGDLDEMASMGGAFDIGALFGAAPKAGPGETVSPEQAAIARTMARSSPRRSASRARARAMRIITTPARGLAPSDRRLSSRVRCRIATA